MLRFWSTCFAMGLAYYVSTHAAEAQPNAPLGVPEAMVELQLPQQILPAGGPNFRQPTPQQIIDALRARGGAGQINRGLAIVGGNPLRANVPLLSLDETPDGVLFRLHIKIMPAQEPVPYELQLGEEQTELIVKRFVNQCTELCQALTEGCSLRMEQWDKLNAAAVVDATRFIRRLRGLFEGTLEEQLAKNLNPREIHQEANRNLSLGIHNPTSLFRKVLHLQITAEQRVDLCRWRATSVIADIDRHAEFLLNAQNRLGKVSHPEPGQQPEPYVKLNLLQQAQLRELIFNSDVTVETLIAADNRQQLSNVLANTDADQLGRFLSPNQVQAVLRHKTTQENHEERIERFRAEIIRRMEPGRVAPKGWHLIPVR